MANKKNPVGRPSALTEVVIGKLEHAASIGCNVLEMCRYAGIGPDTYYDRCKKDKKFADRMDMLRETPIYEARETLAKSIKGGDGDLALKYLERKRKAEFSTLQQVEVGEQGQFKDLTDEQLAQIAAGKATPADFMK